MNGVTGMPTNLLKKYIQMPQAQMTRIYGTTSSSPLFEDSKTLEKKKGHGPSSLS